ncbi:MAG: hypothetical protein PVG22_19440 [Chromatiales bacterium]|jgi:hypothetical protein
MHPFARFIQILGKGRNGMRPLSQAQAHEAMRMAVAWWRQRHAGDWAQEAV